MKRVWNLLLQFEIIEQCESLCTTQIIIENPPEPTLGFDSESELFNPSGDVVASLAY